MRQWLRNLRCRWLGHVWEPVTLSAAETLARLGTLGVILGTGLSTKRCQRCGEIEGRLDL